MAFLPDEAARSGREVSPYARTLYEVFCSHRNWRDGLSACSNSTAIRESGLSRSKFFEAKRELVEQGRRETIKRCPKACEWTKEQLRAPIEAWIKQQLKRT